MNPPHRILITPGEPAGIGPDVCVALASQPMPAECVLIADPNLISQRAKLLKIPVKILEISADDTPSLNTAGTLKIIPVALATEAKAGILNPANAAYVVECLNFATALCLSRTKHALVTGPVQKSLIHAAGISFTGHTEYLAQRCGVDLSIMLFVIDKLKVALLTTHIPLAKVAASVTADLLTRTLTLFHSELQNKFGLSNPRILVCGLNPHAGENGLLGSEENEIMIPALQELQKQGMQVLGPAPADTAFTPLSLAEVDAVLAIYHDQALPVVKTLGFGNAVNVTLGLPLIRTSVDHGTALDKAGTGLANPESLAAAIKLAIDLLK